MTIYITQGHYTERAIKGMIVKPEDRTEAVRAMIELAGGKLLDYYVTFGDYDFLVISEADNDIDMASVVLTAAASGGVTDIKTSVALRTTDAMRAMESAKTLMEGFRAAGERA